MPPRPSSPQLKSRILVPRGPRSTSPATPERPRPRTGTRTSTRTTRPAAHRALRLARGLDGHDATRAALAEGRIHVEQAEVILRALTELPDDLDPDITLKAEQHLLELAADHDAKALQQLGRHILEVASPDAADAHEAKLLEKEERDAAAATRLTMWDDGRGKVHGRFTLDALTGAMLKKALHAYAAPKHRAAKGPLGERRPTPERLGHAFAEYSSATPPRGSPKPAASTPPSWSSCPSRP